MGKTVIEPGDDLTFTRPQVQLIWAPTSKLTFNFQGGVQSQKFSPGPAKSQSTVTYSTIIAYSPVEHTKISFYSVRETPPSYRVNQTSQVNRWNIVLDQRLFQYVFIHTGYSEEHTKNSFNSTGASARVDTGYLYNLRLKTVLFKRASFTALYQHRKQNSDSTGFSFAGSYVGFEINYTY
jgi:hypothetical protein